MKENCPGPNGQNAGAAPGCEGCPSKAACASGENRAPKDDPDLPRIRERLAQVKHKVLVLSGKGGVGKSSVAANLAHLMGGDLGWDVGVMDVDICGPSMPCLFQLEDASVHAAGSGWTPAYATDRISVMSVGFLLQNKDSAVIWRGARKNGLIKQFLGEVEWGALDCLLIDTPPGTSDEHLSVVGLLNAACAGQPGVVGALIVTTPQEVALQDVRKEISFCRKVGLPILGIVENMSGFVCGECGGASEIYRPSTGGAAQLCRDMARPGEPPLRVLAQLPLDPVLARCADAGESPFEHLGDASPTLHAYVQLANAVHASLASH